MVSSFSPQYSAAAEGDGYGLGGAPNPSNLVSEGFHEEVAKGSATPHEPRYPVTGDEVVTFRTVRSINAIRPAILANVDGYRVSWEPAGWDCSCDAPENAVCNHIKAALSYLDPGVFILKARRAVIA